MPKATAYTLVFTVLLCLPLQASQPSCPPTPIYTPCDLVFELSSEELSEHPNPYLSVELAAEFRSPDFRTRRAVGFWDGGNRFVIRFTPTEAGKWTYRIRSNIPRLNNLIGEFTALPNQTPGFIRPANVHHWSYTENYIPHLWMGDTCYRFAFIDRTAFETLVRKRAEQKFNHIRGLVLGWPDETHQVFPSPQQPNPAFFRELDDRIRFMNRHGIIVDLILAADENHLLKVFPSRKLRERYIRYVVARYAPFNVTWQLVQEFEEYDQPRRLLKEIGELVKKYDPYNHPRSTHTLSTSAPLLPDGWMNYIVYQSADIALGAIEHQLYPYPAVNAEFAYEDSGAGRTHPYHVDTDTFRRYLWNITMNGQYPTFGNTGTYGGKGKAVDPTYLDSPGARQMTAWYEFFSKTRHWELEPYFDVSGGRALALQEVEYIVYVEKPGPVEILVPKHAYHVYWFNPITGELIKKRRWKGTRFRATPPTSDHDWVLHLSRDGEKRKRAKRWKFESAPVLMQEIETNLKKIPFKITKPADSTLKVETPIEYAVKITRRTRGTSRMLFLWTADVPASGNGYRVLASGASGQFQIPAAIANDYPAILHLRLYGMNYFGKVYALDEVYRLER